ncbi:MAG: NAD(P)H-binding protein [Phycisphaerales bacterium JB060]
MDQTPSQSPTQNKGTVAVTGATGFVGGHVVRTLLDRGYQVRALSHSHKDTADLRDRNAVTVVVGDINDASALNELIRGCTAVIHLVGIIRESKGKRFQALHVEGTRSILKACQRAGVTRYLHMSALGVDDEARTEYQKTKFKAEQEVRASDLDWTIFRPSLIHGPGGEFTEMMAQWSRGEIAPWIGMPYFRRPETEQRVPLGGVTYVDPEVQPIVVTDVAAYFADALERPETIGEIFNLVGAERISWPAMLEYVHEHVPHAKEGVHPLWAPADIAAIQAKTAQFVGLGNLLPFDEGMATMGAQDSTSSLERVQAYFDREPMPFRESFSVYAGKL